jgi:spoIIIJ-associated protein
MVMATQESIFEGKTLDDAVRMGLNALGLSRAEVMITVMEEGSGGFLGLGARPYKVRVMPRPGGAPREPGERGDRGERRDRKSSGRGRRDGAQRTEGRGDSRREGRGDRDRGRNGREATAGGAPRREERRPEREDRGASNRPTTPAPAPAVADAGAEDDSGRRRRRGRRGGRGRGGDRPMPVGSTAVALEPTDANMGNPVDQPPQFAGSSYERPREDRGGRGRRDDRPRESRGPREGAPDTPALPAADLEALAVRATDQLLTAMGFAAKLTARSDGPNVDVIAEVSDGEDLLIGRKGEVRQALQHLLNLTINRGEGMRYHLQLEINDFWQQRQAELETLARGMADEVARTGTEQHTEYLNAQERRIIHVTLRDDTRVKTYAIGDGLIKKLTVAPAGAGDSREDE